MNFDTGPIHIRDGPSVQPGQVTCKRLLSDVTDRSLRPKTRSVTAHEAAARFDSDSESLSLLSISESDAT